MSAFESEDEVRALLAQYVVRPTRLVKDRLATTLLHQGWRFESSLFAVRSLMKQARGNLQFFSESIDLVLMLCTGDLVQIYPHTEFYLRGAALEASKRYCEPEGIGAEICELAIDFAPIVAAALPSIEGESARIASLQFMHCFSSDRNQLSLLVSASSRAPGILERVAASCISSLMTRPIIVERFSGTNESFQLDFEGVRLLLPAALLSNIDVPIMSGAWEIALIRGAMLSGCIETLIALVSYLDDWRQDECNAAIAKSPKRSGDQYLS